MTDITIRGAGIFGLAIAWECIKRGARVRIIDPRGSGGGASGGIVGAMAPHVPEKWNVKKEFQFQSLISAGAFWHELKEEYGISSGYARFGRVQPIKDEASLILAKKRCGNAKTLWKGKANLWISSGQPIWGLKSATGYWLYDDLTARINPKKACLALETALNANGVRVLKSGNSKGVVLWATGVHDLLRISKRYNSSFGKGIKGQAALFELDRSNAPQIFAESINFVPHANGTMAVGSTSEVKYYNAKICDRKLDELISSAKGLVPELETAKVIMRWAEVRPRVISRSPVMGHHPIDSNAFIANGGFKIGFGIANKVAKLMADLILDGKNKIPEQFLPSASL